MVEVAGEQLEATLVSELRVPRYPVLLGHGTPPQTGGSKKKKG